LAFNPINWLLGLFSLDIAIDLGTANTLVNVRGKGIVINEPSWVTIDKRLRQPLAIGLEAKEMMGRTPSSVAVIRPLRDGVISEFDITQVMLEYFIGRVHEQSVVPLPRPRVIVGIPTGVTEVEKRAVYDAVMASGARSAFMIVEPIASALGAGLPLADVKGSMVVDIGGGTTEVAVMSLSGVVASRSLRVAGDEMDQDILRQVGDTSDDAGVGDADDHLLRGEAALAPEPAQRARHGGDVGDLACDDGATRKRDLRHLLQDWPTSTHGELDGPDGVRPDVETDDVTADHEDYLGT
jgi:MreB/Mrl family cell shape determining protein